MEPSKKALKYARKGLAWIVKEGHKYDLDLFRVNVNTINQATSHRCLLSQAGARDYTTIMTSIENDKSDMEGSWEIQHGFDVDDMPGGNNPTAEELDAAFKTLLSALRSGPGGDKSAPQLVVVTEVAKANMSEAIIDSLEEVAPNHPYSKAILTLFEGMDGPEWDVLRTTVLQRFNQLQAMS